jgi:hypothetical protein
MIARNAKLTLRRSAAYVGYRVVSRVGGDKRRPVLKNFVAHRSMRKGKMVAASSNLRHPRRLNRPPVAGDRRREQRLRHALPAARFASYSSTVIVPPARSVFPASRGGSASCTTSMRFHSANGTSHSWRGTYREAATR